MKVPEKELSVLFEWACSTLRGRTLAPWEYYQIMKLRDVTGSLLKGVDPLTAMEEALELDDIPRVRDLTEYRNSRIAEPIPEPQSILCVVETDKPS